MLFPGGFLSVYQGSNARENCRSACQGRRGGDYLQVCWLNLMFFWKVAAGVPVCVIEAMKSQTLLTAECDGKVRPEERIW